MTETIDSCPARSRRALLAGGLGALGAWVAGAATLPGVARAGVDGDVVLGSSANVSATTTKVTVATADFSALWGNATGTGNVVGVRGDAGTVDGAGVWGNNTGGGSGVYGAATGLGSGVKGSGATGPGVQGTSQTGSGVQGSCASGNGVSATGWTGVYAFGTSLGVVGESTEGPGMYGASIQASGVHGQSESATGVVAHSGPFQGMTTKPKTGLYAEATQDAASRGAWGRSNAGRGVFGEATTGHGVYGQATSGVGLFGTATSGYALRTSGRIRADKVSGVATIRAGNTAVTVSPGVDVTATSFVLLTPKVNLGSRGLWFTTNATANTVTIRISSARPAATPIAWLLLG